MTKKTIFDHTYIFCVISDIPLLVERFIEAYIYRLNKFLDANHYLTFDYISGMLEGIWQDDPSDYEDYIFDGHYLKANYTQGTDKDNAPCYFITLSLVDHY